MFLLINWQYGAVTLDCSVLNVFVLLCFELIHL